MPTERQKVRLLFDQNVSPRLVELVSDLFPKSLHVQSIGLEHASDDAIWLYARVNGLTIVAKDADFDQMGVLRGIPPKVIWVRLGNCTTDQIATSLRENISALEDFVADPGVGTFVLR